MSRCDIPLPQPQKFLGTARTDPWWTQPTAVLIGLGFFIVYATWAAFQGEHFFLHSGGANYLSPFYSPVLFDPPGVHTGHAWFGDWPSWMPTSVWIIPITPALFILWAPGGFRFTCYYYRGAYYKAFWGDPPACGVGEPGFRGKKYRGEAKLPLLIQNIHRYMLYVAVVFLFILSYDAIISYFFLNEATGNREFGIGVGSLILTLNPIFLGAYTLGCHSMRHLVGGRLNILSKHPLRKKAYDCSSCLNKRHMQWAWVSLIWVAFCDVYVRLCSMGVWTDFRLL